MNIIKICGISEALPGTRCIAELGNNNGVIYSLQCMMFIVSTKYFVTLEFSVAKFMFSLMFVILRMYCELFSVACLLSLIHNVDAVMVGCLSDWYG